MDFLVVVIILIIAAYTIGDNQHNHNKHIEKCNENKELKFHPNGYSFILLNKDDNHLTQFTMKKMYDLPNAELYCDFDMSNVVKNNIVEWHVNPNYTKIFIADSKDNIFVFDMSTSNDLMTMGYSYETLQMGV